MKKLHLSGTAKSNKAASDKIAPNKRPKPFPIVGFGASAGGIKAFTSLLTHLDPNLGMAYVLVMHLSPNHKSALAEIVQSKTKMPVKTVKNGMEVKANTVFVIPPNTFMSVVDGHLKLAPRSLTSIGNFAIDYFFTGLATVYKNNAIGVILSGTATDGTLGLKAIKAEGGITFAQDQSAEFSGMPQSANDAGYVDFMLPPDGIAKELSRLVKMPYTVLPAEKVAAIPAKEMNGHGEQLKKVLSIVKVKTGVDFFLHYKQASIYRRVVRRMTLNKFETLQEYTAMLRINPKEVDALYDDFLINVTHFFRDPEFYKALNKVAFPTLIKKGKTVDSLRLWIAGCATGEEAYSVAITLIEYLESHDLTVPIHIFASDLDANAIEKARLGIYSASALQMVSPQFVKTYFKKVGNYYQIIKSVREVCVFSQHNLLKDPPFSRIDLISCQNVLIYLENEPQKKILQTFHYALRPQGCLYLGKSETIGGSTDLFELRDKKSKLYFRKPTSTPHLEFTVHSLSNPSKHAPRTEQVSGSEKAMERLMLSNYVHPSVVVNKSMRITQFFGVTGPYLAPVAGKASFNILKMVREDLVIDLGNLLQQARKTEKITIKEGIHIRTKGVLQEIAIEVVPRYTDGGMIYLVVFREGGNVQVPVAHKSDALGSHKDRTIVRLEEELAQSRGLIRVTNEEYETTYEELQANNEEILSSNEELQSVNEELETSKEELQSSNEELTTTNEELGKRNTELRESQGELKKVNGQLEEFAFISSHDLQEPLRKIETFSDFLSSPEANLNEYAKKYSSKINTSATRMSALIRDLLEFSVLIKYNDRKKVMVDLNETVKHVIEDFEVIIEKKEAIIKVSPLPSLCAEPVQMTQLFHNLISNALRFAKSNPIITVSAREANGKDHASFPELSKDTPYVALIVTDNGVGFDQKYVNKIFLLFQRLNNGTEGTGVGLAICKKIVDDHKGFIHANGKENGGATFTVFLPTNLHSRN